MAFYNQRYDAPRQDVTRLPKTSVDTTDHTRSICTGLQVLMDASDIPGDVAREILGFCTVGPAPIEAVDTSFAKYLESYARFYMSVLDVFRLQC